MPTDDRFEKSLREINCREDDIIVYLRNKDFYHEKHDFIFVSSCLGWMPYEGKPRCKYYENNGYKFMGNINIEDYELVAKKYNL